MTEASNSRRRGRKRPRPSFLMEDNTPSDPALFSSDPPDPSAEHYFSPREKKKYRGTWWQPNESGQRKERKAFERNLDSGVFMGSDSSLESVDAEEAEDSKSDDPVPHEAFDLDGTLPSQGPRLPLRRTYVPEPYTVIEARKRITYFVEDGSFVDLEELDPDIRLWLRQRFELLDADHLDLSLNLPYLTDDMLSPLRQMVRQPAWGQRTLRIKNAASIKPRALDDSENASAGSLSSLDSDEDLDELRKPYTLDLSRNALSDLPPSLFTLPNLMHLSLANNNLSHIPPNISKLRQLGTLQVQGNRLRWLPGEVIDLICTTEHKRLRVYSGVNLLLQPFSYRTLDNLIRDADGYESERVPIIPYTVADLKKRMARIEKVDASVIIEPQARILLQMHKNWMLRMYEHYLSIPEMIWLQATWQRNRIYTDEEQQEIINKWGRGSPQRLSALDPLWHAVESMRTQVGHALRHQTILLAATAVCLLDITGRPVDARTKMLPSETSMDQMILPARLLAVPEPPIVCNVPGQVIKSIDACRPAIAPTVYRQRVHSLFSLSLASASTVPELNHLPSLLPEDTPDTVTRGLDHALEARRVGGRTCHVCQRSYIVPRAEWFEYHVLSNMFEDERLVEYGFEDLFVPFLRRVCSWGCVPRFEFDDD